MKFSDSFRKKMKPRYCHVELTENRSTPYHVEFIARYRVQFNVDGDMYGTKITVATHSCRYAELQDIIDAWIDQAKLPNEP
ncbi:MAG: hypothetical protein F4W92_08870 [Gammaproteobacteria bacterium]|nr:hypothetical protein [Gammaproteobacteria bacterium]